MLLKLARNDRKAETYSTEASFSGSSGLSTVRPIGATTSSDEVAISLILEVNGERSWMVDGKYYHEKEVR